MQSVTVNAPPAAATPAVGLLVAGLLVGAGLLGILRQWRFGSP